MTNKKSNHQYRLAKKYLDAYEEQRATYKDPKKRREFTKAFLPAMQDMLDKNVAREEKLDAAEAKVNKAIERMEAWGSRNAGSSSEKKKKKRKKKGVKRRGLSVEKED